MMAHDDGAAAATAKALARRGEPPGA